MLTSFGHLSYCTNIHPGESWKDHFDEMNKSIPEIKKQVSPNDPFGIGLRLSNRASIELSQEQSLREFKYWLKINDCYVYTMNGFPFGNFHHQPVKDLVYAPDWTNSERVIYTVRLFNLLKELLPQGMEGSISTAPLSYRHWWKGELANAKAIEQCTQNILEVVLHLIKIQQKEGVVLHLNIEPEPDGLLENTSEFIQWYTNHYIPLGIQFLKKHSGISIGAEAYLRQHLCLCFDVCHSALAYEVVEDVFEQLFKHGISVGKVQLSSAVKIDLNSDREQKLLSLMAFNEPIYLHQVVARDDENRLYKFRDLSEALDQLKDTKFSECRVHFHVPVFSPDYESLSSTQENILQTLYRQNIQKTCNHWEVETYSWNILPEDFRLPINASIIRELDWILKQMSLTKIPVYE